MTIHFFVNFDIFKWLYLAYYWFSLHQTWEFCKAWSALYHYGSTVANPIIHRLVPSPSRFEIRQLLSCSLNRHAVFTTKFDTSKIPSNHKSKECRNSLFTHTDMKPPSPLPFLGRACIKWMGVPIRISEKNPRDTKILFCGHGLKCFAPLAIGGTNCSPVIFFKAHYCHYSKCYSKNPHTRTCGLRTPRLKFGKKGAYI